jgi:hypothetical protein
MSLLTAASVWKTNNDKKKRQPSLKKPSLNKEESLEETTQENFANISETFKNAHKEGEVRNNHVMNLINKMTTEDNDDDNLANFEPMANPTSHIKTDFPSIENNNVKYNPNQHGKAFSNYNGAYAKPETMGSMPTATHGAMGNDKLLEKINYMIRLLEEQQHEKTENITEEFILYGFLGIFVIYVVDSFTKCGKYIR